MLRLLFLYFDNKTYITTLVLSFILYLISHYTALLPFESIMTLSSIFFSFCGCGLMLKNGSFIYRKVMFIIVEILLTVVIFDMYDNIVHYGLVPYGIEIGLSGILVIYSIHFIQKKPIGVIDIMKWVCVLFYVAHSLLNMHRWGYRYESRIAMSLMFMATLLTYIAVNRKQLWKIKEYDEDDFK
ncbi:MAG: hypothetical protein AAFX87_27735 [Bacteroidota bacterium]